MPAGPRARSSVGVSGATNRATECPEDVALKSHHPITPTARTLTSAERHFAPLTPALFLPQLPSLFPSQTATFTATHQPHAGGSRRSSNDAVASFARNEAKSVRSGTMSNTTTIWEPDQGSRDPLHQRRAGHRPARLGRQPALAGPDHPGVARADIVIRRDLLARPGRERGPQPRQRHAGRGRRPPRAAPESQPTASTVPRSRSWPTRSPELAVRLCRRGAARAPTRGGMNFLASSGLLAHADPAVATAPTLPGLLRARA